MPELQLNVNLNGWRVFTRRKLDPAFQAMTKKVFARDSYACQYCGFQAQEYQEVINADGNYANNKLTNLLTACCFCSQCLFLQTAGADDISGGQLIYLPEMSQAKLNSFCHVLFCAMGNGTGYQDTAQTIYRDFKFRSQQLENKLGNGTSNPAVFGQLILEYTAEASNFKAESILKDMRLLPSYTKFRVQLEAWAASALAELSQEGQ